MCVKRHVDGGFLDSSFLDDCFLVLTFSHNKIPLGETGCLENTYFLLDHCLGIQFFESPPNTVS